VTADIPPQVAERLEALRTRPIDVTNKGFGLTGSATTANATTATATTATATTATAATLSAARPPLHAAGFTYPLLTLHESALHHNAQAMAAYCAAHGIDLAPHGKTAMSPELAAMQLSHGAWAITVATIDQLRLYRGFGFPRLLLANELLDEAGIAWLAQELAEDPGFDAYCYVDSMQGVNTFIRTLGGTTPQRPVPVLIEIGHDSVPGGSGRTGCRTDEEALAIAKAAQDSGVLRVAGVAGYEGTIKGGDDELGRVSAFCRRLRALADRLRQPGEEFIVTAGGSTYFDIVTEELTAAPGLRVVLRSGAYLYYDHGLYATISPQARGTAGAPRFRPAIELWAQVLSRPEPGLALLGFGRRDAGSDSALPVPLRVVSRAAPTPANPDPASWRVTQLSDQHAFLELPADVSLDPGDLVGLGISHPCTTLDKWRVIPVVSDDGLVTDVVHAFF
jgi:D-serine deaminase-like pyridoxal phosphate-dependent protein